MNEINEALRSAFVEADEKLVLNELGESEHSFSLDFRKKLKLNAAPFFKNGKYVGNAKNKARLTLPRRMIAVACVLFLFIGVAVNAEAIGDMFARWMLVPDTTSTHVSFEIPNGVTVPEIIEKRYRLESIPYGYGEVQNGVTPRFVWVDYEDEYGNSLHFTQLCYGAVSVTMDTENAEVVETKIMGHKGYIVTKGVSVRLIWENGEYCFELDSSSLLSLEEMIVIAESITEIP